MLVPKIRLPLWLAGALPLAAYAFRSIVLRGGDWRLDLPWDPVLFVLLGMLVVLVGIMRSRAAREHGEGQHGSDGPGPDEH